MEQVSLDNHPIKGLYFMVLGVPQVKCKIKIVIIQRNAISITFLQQILDFKLLLVFNWDNHFKLCIKKTTNKKPTKEDCA